jgi:hypothetical protein
MRIINRLIELAFGIIFITAALFKFTDLVAFAFGIINSGLFPDWISVLLTYFIPSIELLVGISIIVFSKNRILLNVAVFLLVVYSIYLVLAQFTIYNSNCSCSSFLGLTVVQNLILNFCLIILMFLRTSFNIKEKVS